MQLKENRSGNRNRGSHPRLLFATLGGPDCDVLGPKQEFIPCDGRKTVHEAPTPRLHLKNLVSEVPHLLPDTRMGLGWA